MATPIPADLKAITPFITRANELVKADPVVAYWCSYYAVQLAMTLGSKAPESNLYLFSLMDKLEVMKAELDHNENVVNDTAASTYLDAFAGKIFDQADDEDRSGKGSKMTAKKFLAAGNFLELQSLFGEMSNDNREKIKYSKWKASDIAKAIREGRAPTPGPAGGLPVEEDLSNEESRELARELAAMSSLDNATAPIPDIPVIDLTHEEDVEASYPFPQQPTTLPSGFSSPPPPSDANAPAEEEQPTTPAFPDFLDTPTTIPSSSPRLTLPLPPPSIQTHQTASLALPNPSIHATAPVFASAVFPTVPPLPLAQTPTWTPSPPAPSIPPTPVVRSPFITSPVPVASAPPPPAEVTNTLDPMLIGTIQKHAKWAISALNYDDLDTARKELRAALILLGD